VDQINADPRKLILTSKKEDLSANSTGIRGLRGQLDQGSVKIWRRVRRGCSLSPILFNLYRYTIPRKLLRGLET